jgi:Rieske Fe-S protein
LVCPCHGAKFTLDGTLIGGPSPRGLKRFEVQMRPDGHVFVGKELS